MDGVTADDLVMELLTAALQWRPWRGRVSPATRRLVGRAKEYLQAHLTGAVHLTEVASAIGASAAYLTHAFRRVEGSPSTPTWCSCVWHARWSSCPHAEHLTDLALTLGFSRHNHFTSAFRIAFGCTPSAYRRATTSVGRDATRRSAS